MELSDSPQLRSPTLLTYRSLCKLLWSHLPQSTTYMLHVDTSLFSMPPIKIFKVTSNQPALNSYHMDRLPSNMPHTQLLVVTPPAYHLHDARNFCGIYLKNTYVLFTLVIRCISRYFFLSWSLAFVAALTCQRGFQVNIQHISIYVFSGLS